jgi:hypothetical protein
MGNVPMLRNTRRLAMVLQNGMTSPLSHTLRPKRLTKTTSIWKGKRPRRDPLALGPLAFPDRPFIPPAGIKALTES